MTKFVDSLGLKRLVTKIAEAVSNGTWLPVKEGMGTKSIAEGKDTTAYGDFSHAEGKDTTASENGSHAEGLSTKANGYASHAQGMNTTASGSYSHTEGFGTTTSEMFSHAQGCFNFDDPSFIDMIGVGTDTVKKNASVIYVKRDPVGDSDPSFPKNGYQYLLGVGGYQGEVIEEGMKSVQEVIADLEKGVAATETMTVEEIREIMSA